MKNMNRFKTFFAAALLLAATSAQAVIINEEWIWYDAAQSQGEGQYTVINNTATDIYAFAVGNDYPTGNYPDASSSSVGWEAMTVTATDWDLGIDMYFWDSITFASTTVSTSSLGAFADLFPGYSSAFLYSYFTDISWSPIMAGSTESGFMFGSQLLGSPFVAIDFNGGIVDAHNAVHVSAVPLPAAVWLFSFGLGALGLVARRRRA